MLRWLTLGLALSGSVVETSSRSEAPEAERSEAMEASRDRVLVAALGAAFADHGSGPFVDVVPPGDGGCGCTSADLRLASPLVLVAMVALRRRRTLSRAGARSAR